MHFFKAFTFAVIVIWCEVEGSHSKSKHKLVNHERSSPNNSSGKGETSSVSSDTTTNKISINITLSVGTHSASSTVFKKTLSETTDNISDDKTIDDIVKSEEVATEKSTLDTEATSEPNVTESAPVFRPRLKHRQAIFRTNRTRYSNSTIRRQRLYRNGFGPHWRTLDNGTRVRLHRKLIRGRGDNATFKMRAQRIKKLRKRRTTSTNKPERGIGLYDTTDTTLSDNKHNKKGKHHTSSTEKVKRDRPVFSDTEHEKKRTHHKKSKTSDNKSAPKTGTERKEHTSQKASSIKTMKDLVISESERKKDISLSDIEHMDLLKQNTTSPQKALSDKFESSDIDVKNKKDNSLTDNEHETLLKPHTSSTKKNLRSGPASYDTNNEKNKDFSNTESRESVEKPQKQRAHRWPKRKGKKVARQGKKYGRHHPLGNSHTTVKRKPNSYRHGTEQTTNTHKKTTKADLGNILKAYTIKAHMNALKCKFSNVNITVEVIGRTVSYYDIVMIKASAKRQSYDDAYFRANENRFADDGPEKRIVFIVHGLSVMGIHDLPCLVEVEEFEKLVSYYFAHLDKFDVFLIPMANPDGVAVSNTNHRSYTKYDGFDWNKNKSPQSECSGVALDRNFDVAWSLRRNLSTCNQQYPGPYPFSEQESKAIKNVLHRYSQRIVAYLNVHSGTYTPKIFKGDAVLYPKGYTDVQTDDDKYIDLRGEIDEALKNASFQVYTVAVDTLYNWYGKVGGTSVDYAASVYGIPYSMELVMQLYEFVKKSNEEEQEQKAVLRTSWRRVIDVIFNSVHRYTNATSV